MTDQIHLVVATPCFGGQVSSIYAGSIFQLQRARPRQVQSRSQGAVARWRRADHARAGQSGDAVPRRSRRDASAVRGRRYRLYARAGVSADRIRRRRRRRRLSDQAGQLGQGEAGAGIEAGRTRRRPRSTMCSRSTTPIASSVVNGFTRVRYAGTGFLMIRRHVLEQMCAHPDYASLQFFREHSHDALAGSHEPVRTVRLHDRSEDRNLPQRGFRVLQTLDRYRRRNLGRSRKPSRSRRTVGVSRRCRLAVRGGANRGGCRVRSCE